jgi:hypothetical protein
VTVGVDTAGDTIGVVGLVAAGAATDSVAGGTGDKETGFGGGESRDRPGRPGCGGGEGAGGVGGKGSEF